MSTDSLRLLEAAVGCARDIVLITDNDTGGDGGPRIVFVNEAFVTLTGYGKAEVLGKSPGFLLESATRHEAQERIVAAMKNGESRREELRCENRQGMLFWLDLDFTPIADSTGGSTHWVMIGRDITERRQTNGALLASLKHYRQLFASNPVPVWVYDLDTLQFLDVNDIACARYGYSRQEFLAMTIRDIRPPEDVMRLEQSIVTRDGAAVQGSGPWRHLRKDGSVIMVEINSLDAMMHGHRARFVCPIDVTEKIYAQEEIRRMNLVLERKVEMRTGELSTALALQQSLFDNLPELVWLANLDGWFTFVNRIWAEKIGTAANDWQDGGWTSKLHPEDFDRVTLEWRGAVAAKDSFESAYRMLHRDGGYHDYQVAARKVFNPAADAICWVGICGDVTDSRRREDALRYANQELEAFSSSVSHDLRAPLRTIAGFSERLQLESADRLDEQSRHYLERIRAGAANMSELIDDLLSLSRITRSGVAMEKVDLSTLAGLVFEELRQQQPDHRAEIVIQENMTVVGDAHLLRVVLVNLIGNALKFSGKREISRIEVGEEVQPGDTSIFFVRDNGAGFDPAYAAKMFGIFQRLHSAKEFPGTGIGLATVKRIIYRHGGQVSAEGAVDQGAKICFSLRRE